jgi:hypothetical protein
MREEVRRYLENFFLILPFRLYRSGDTQKPVASWTKCFENKGRVVKKWC